MEYIFTRTTLYNIMHLLNTASCNIINSLIDYTSTWYLVHIYLLASNEVYMQSDSAEMDHVKIH